MTPPGRLFLGPDAEVPLVLVLRPKPASLVVPLVGDLEASGSRLAGLLLVLPGDVRLAALPFLLALAYRLRARLWFGRRFWSVATTGPLSGVQRGFPWHYLPPFWVRIELAKSLLG